MSESGTRERLAELRRQMMENPGRSWSLAEMARVACLSRSAFAEHFRQAYHRSPRAYLTWLRMDLARGLLQSGKMPLREVALCAGYRSPAAFSHAFRKFAGCPPGRYRDGGRPESANG